MTANGTYAERICKQVYMCVCFVRTNQNCDIKPRLSVSTLFSGSIIGVISSISTLLIVGSLHEGGLSDFYTNTTQPYSLLAGITVGFVVGGIVSIGVSLKTHKITSEDDTEREWAKTMNIDNPINPFRAIYEEELAGVDAGTARLCAIV